MKNNRNHEDDQGGLNLTSESFNLTSESFKIIVNGKIDINKQTVYLDVDDVILNSSEVVVDIVNKRYRIPNNLEPRTVDDIHSWDYQGLHRELSINTFEEIFANDEFWEKVELSPAFLSLLRDSLGLVDKYNWILVTKGLDDNLLKKYKFIYQHPQVEPHKHLLGMYGLGLYEEKSKIKMFNGIQIDDNYDNLLNTDARIKILVTNGRETNYNAFYRTKDNLENLYIVNDFEEALDILRFNVEVKL